MRCHVVAKPGSPELAQRQKCWKIRDTEEVAAESITFKIRWKDGFWLLSVWKDL